MWRIKNWPELYENNRSREITTAKWVPVPNKQDGDGYLSLLDHEHGLEHYAAFIATVLLASKCAPRGDLVKSNGIAHTPESISQKVHIRAAIIQAMLDRCSRPEVDWVEWVDSGGQVDGDPIALFPQSGRQAGAVPSARTGKGTGTSPPGDAAPPGGTAGGEGPATEIRFRCQGKPAVWALSAGELATLVGDWPGVQVEACLRDLARRQEDQPTIRRTARDMPRYLQSWLEQEVAKYKRFLRETPGAAPSPVTKRPPRGDAGDDALALLEKSRRAS